MTKVVDCVARMLQFKQQCPAAEFDLKPNLFTARVPGHDEPFQAMSLCRLMDNIERWTAEETMARLLFGKQLASSPLPWYWQVKDDGSRGAPVSLGAGALS
jgi:hypothetical protein